MRWGLEPWRVYQMATRELGSTCVVQRPHERRFAHCEMVSTGGGFSEAGNDPWARLELERTSLGRLAVSQL